MRYFHFFKNNNQNLDIYVTILNKEYESRGTKLSVKTEIKLKVSLHFAPYFLSNFLPFFYELHLI
jgi:hypothetical protein